MVSIQMKVGPKGQVVIPKVFRDEFGIRPGDKVVMKDEKQSITVQKPKVNWLETIEKIRKKVKKFEDVDIDKEYAEQLEERWRKSQK